MLNNIKYILQILDLLSALNIIIPIIDCKVSIALMGLLELLSLLTDIIL